MIIRRDPFNVLNELNKLFDGSIQRSWQQDDSAVESSNWLPAVDIKEEKDCFLLHVDVPGVSPDKIDVSMENNMLSVKGERDDIQKEDRKGYHRIERTRGSFYRRFTLPDTADAGQIKAKVKQGVLEVYIGKKKSPESRKIQVNIED